MMRRSRVFIIMGIFAALAAIPSIGLAQVAPSPELCEARTYTDVDGMDLQTTRLDQAITALENQGANVHVYVFQDVGSADLVSLLDTELQEACQDWQINAVRDPNLIVIGVAIEQRGVAEVWGENWDEYLDGRTANLEDAMGVEFRRADFAGGIALGLETIDERINYVSPWPGVFRFLGLAFVTLLALGALVLLGRAVVIRRELRQQVRQMQEKMNAAYYDLDEERETSVQRAELKLGNLSPQDGKSISGEVAKLDEEFAALTEEFSELSAKVDRTGSPRDHQMWLELEDEVDTMRRRIGSLAKRYSKVQDELNRLSLLEQNLVANLEAMAQKRNLAFAAIEEVESGGLKTDNIRAIVASADVLGNKAVALSNRRSPLSADKKRLEAVGKYQQAVQAASELSVRYQALNKRHGSLQNKLQPLAKSIEEGRKLFEEMKSHFASVNWDSISGNGSQAEKRLEASREQLDAAGQELSLEVQDLDSAEQRLDQVDAWQADVASFMRSVSARRQHLADAVSGSKEHLAAVREELAEVRGYLEQNLRDLADDGFDYGAALENVEDALVAAERELSSAKPDYLLVTDNVMSADKRLDELLLKMKDRRRHMESLRRQVQEARRSAKNALSQSEEYIEDHSFDVGPGAENELALAKRKWRQASSKKAVDESNLVLLLAVYVAINSHADKAMSSAQHDVSDAQRSSSSSYSSSSSSSSSSRSSSSWDSGGGSSFGDFGGGGGSSFGSFGGGGGSSGGGW